MASIPAQAQKRPGAAQTAAVAGTTRAPAVRIPAPGIPFTKFVLPNGLTVIHLEDKRTPTVTVQIWYKVGSRNESKGRTGFAHLFEHLMFNGSEHFNDDWFKATQTLGATNLNGTTAEDRTNYYQTVPKGALDSILWLESDRMGYLLGAIDQGKVDEQRKVVQNEKRERANEPLASVPDRIMAATRSTEHPYGHSVIGSMEDLDAASVEDVKQWFRDWYGPNNAVLVLAGDLTLAEAKEKASKYFGAIPGGKPVGRPVAWIQKLTSDQREVTQDRVPATVVFRAYNVPGYGDPDGERLDAIASALAGDRNSRLTRRLVYEEGLATKVAASNAQDAIEGRFTIQVSLKPGVDAAKVERILDQELGKLLAKGPTADELGKDRIQRARQMIDLTESVPAKGNLLAVGEMFAGDPGDWKASYDRANAVTPASAAAAARKWLTGGSYTLVVEPFPNLQASASDADRSKMPVPAAIADVPFPAYHRFTLSNGIEVWLAERHETPKVTMAMNVRIGTDPDFLQRKPGTGTLTLRLLSDGTAKRSGAELVDQVNRLGGTFGVGQSGDYATVQATSLTATLDPMIGIWADAIRNPAFRQSDFERQKGLVAQGLAQSMNDPGSIAQTTLARTAWGPAHPYGRSPTPDIVATIGRDDVTGFYKRWFGPNNARIVIVGDTSEAAIRPRLEAAFAGWAPAPGKPMTVPVGARPAKPLVYLIDAPGAQQSIIQAGAVTTPFDPATDDAEDMFNTIFGGGFTSRINMNLREAKGWSYGSFSSVSGGTGPRIFAINAPVQTDATKGALVELKRELANVTGPRLPTAKELDAVRGEAILKQVGQWGSSDSVAGGLETIARYHLPQDYWNRHPAELRGVTLDQVSAQGRKLLPDDRLVWVVVGDLSKIETDIRGLNLGEVHVVDASGKLVR